MQLQLSKQVQLRNCKYRQNTKPSIFFLMVPRRVFVQVAIDRNIFDKWEISLPWGVFVNLISSLHENNFLAWRKIPFASDLRNVVQNVEILCWSSMSAGVSTQPAAVNLFFVLRQCTRKKIASGRKLSKNYFVIGRTRTSTVSINGELWKGLRTKKCPDASQLERFIFLYVCVYVSVVGRVDRFCVCVFVCPESAEQKNQMPWRHYRTEKVNGCLSHLNEIITVLNKRRGKNKSVVILSHFYPYTLLSSSYTVKTSKIHYTTTSRHHLPIEYLGVKILTLYFFSRHLCQGLCACFGVKWNQMNFDEYGAFSKKKEK